MHNLSLIWLGGSITVGKASIGNQQDIGVGILNESMDVLQPVSNIFI
jgi:hypothetical protein